MTARRHLSIPGEYANVARALYLAGVGHLAHAAHTMAITPEDATQTIREILGAQTMIAFRGYRGRARKGHPYRVTMPAASGARPDGAPHLRLGIVLHECAHVIAWSRYGWSIAPHGREFCDTFAELLRRY